jgi:hypothetical protein
VIYSAAEIYLRIDNNLGTCDVSAVGNHRMYFHRNSHTVGISASPQDLWHQIDMNACVNL